MEKITSKDGTTIAYEKSGSGPALIIVSGSLGMLSADLVKHLSPHFTVIDYYRRGRGESTDTQPYAVQREVEDIEALIDAAGGSALLYGKSSGAVLALEAASKLPTKVTKLVMYEPPLIVNDSRPPVPDGYIDQVNAAVAEGRRGDAVATFLTQAVGMPAEVVAKQRQAPFWAGMESVAHTIAYDHAIMQGLMSGKPLPAGRWASATMPTLLITGGKSPQFFHDGAKAVVSDLPDAQHRMLDGQDHNVAPEALAPMLVEFLK